MAKLLDRTHSYSKINPLNVFFAFVFVAFCFPVLLYPLFNLLFSTVGQFLSLPPYLSKLVFVSLRFSLLQATLSTLLSGILGVLVAFYIFENGRGVRSWVWKFSLISFSLPSLVLVLALISFWGNEGLGFSLFGWKGILLCHVAMNYPLFMKVAGEGWMATGREEEMSALSLGAKRSQVFFFVTLPKLKNSLLSAALLCFTYCFCSFIPVSILGADPTLSTFELNIYQALKFENDLPKAALLACIQAVFLFPLFIFFKSLPFSASNLPSQKKIRIYALQKDTNILVGLVLFFILLLVSFAPLLWTILQAISNLKTIESGELFSGLQNSLRLAGYALSFVLPVALSAAYLQRHSKVFSRVISWLTVVPLFVPVMLLAASFSFSFSSVLNFFRESYWAVAIIQATVLLPLVTRVLENGFQSVSLELEQTAISLGANPLQVFTNVEIPQIFRPILLASGLAVCFSLGEVGSLLLFGSNLDPTLSLLIFQKLGRYALGEATVIASLLIILMGTILWGIEKCKLS